MLFGEYKYEYKWSPMGVKCPPYFAQQVVEVVLCNIEDTGIYLDNNCAFSMTWEHHILLLNKILHSFSINLLKFQWDIQETNCLVYWLTPTRLKHWHKQLMLCYKCRSPKIFHKSVASLVLAITTDACGHNMCTSLPPIPAILGRKPFVGLMK